MKSKTEVRCAPGDGQAPAREPKSQHGISEQISHMSPLAPSQERSTLGRTSLPPMTLPHTPGNPPGIPGGIPGGNPAVPNSSQARGSLSTAFLWPLQKHGAPLPLPLCPGQSAPSAVSTLPMLDRWSGRSGGHPEAVVGSCSGRLSLQLRSEPARSGSLTGTLPEAA